MSLVEAIKKLRARDSVIFSEPVRWPLNECFIGEPINITTVSKISRFIDYKIVEYAQKNQFIHGPLTPMVKESPDKNVSWCANDGFYVPRNRNELTRLDDFKDKTGHMEIRLPEPLPPAPGKVAFITAYDLDYSTLTVNTRIVVAPSTEVIPDAEWFDFGDCLSTRDQIKKSLKENLTVLIKHRNSPIPVNQGNPEHQALLTLREMISEAEFRKYLKDGFLLVKIKNRTYQIFRDKPHTKVYQDGKLIEEVCVRIKDKKIPATDNVIAFKTILEVSEEQLRSMANVYKMKG
jgi:hypothetical protein